MNINEACGCYAIISRKVQYLPMSRLGPYRHCRHCNSYTKVIGANCPGTSGTVTTCEQTGERVYNQEWRGGSGRCGWCWQ